MCNIVILAGHFNVQYCDIGRALQSQLEACGLNFKAYMPAKNQNSFFLTPINKGDKLFVIKHFKSYKAPDSVLIG